MRALVIPVALAGCDLGIGSDPASGPDAPCLAGNVRGATGCFVPRVGISINGAVEDWSTVSPVAVSSTCADSPCAGLSPVTIRFAAGGRLEFEPNILLVEVAFDGPPPQNQPDLRVVLSVAASPLRPAIGGFDRLIFAADGLHYEKSGFEVTTPANPKPFQWAFTPAGFEAAIFDEWLPYQGAGLVSASIERDGRPVATFEPVTACWTAYESLGPRACEELP